MIWFTADHHFGHDNIRKYCNRPFDSIQEMDKEMIHRWNEVVKGPEDIVYHLGDLTLGDFSVARRVVSQLHGDIKVLSNHWHHDKRWLPASTGSVYLFSRDKIQVQILSPLTVLKFERYRSQRHPLAVSLCHYPLAEWEQKHYGGWMLHGHSHGRHKGEGFIHDVGVDANDFYPISLENIAEIMEWKGWRPLDRLQKAPRVRVRRYRTRPVERVAAP